MEISIPGFDNKNTPEEIPLDRGAEIEYKVSQVTNTTAGEIDALDEIFEQQTALLESSKAQREVDKEIKSQPKPAPDAPVSQDYGIDPRYRDLIGEFEKRQLPGQEKTIEEMEKEIGPGSSAQDLIEEGDRRETNMVDLLTGIPSFMEAVSNKDVGAILATMATVIPFPGAKVGKLAKGVEKAAGDVVDLEVRRVEKELAAELAAKEAAKKNTITVNPLEDKIEELNKMIAENKKGWDERARILKEEQAKASGTNVKQFPDQKALSDVAKSDPDIKRLYDSNPKAFEEAVKRVEDMATLRNNARQLIREMGKKLPEGERKKKFLESMTEVDNIRSPERLEEVLKNFQGAFEDILDMEK